MSRTCADPKKNNFGLYHPHPQIPRMDTEHQDVAKILISLSDFYVGYTVEFDGVKYQMRQQLTAEQLNQPTRVKGEIQIPQEKSRTVQQQPQRRMDSNEFDLVRKVMRTRNYYNRSDYWWKYSDKPTEAKHNRWLNRQNRALIDI